MYKVLLQIVSFSLLSACAGGHDLDSPVKTCKAVASQLLPFSVPDNALGELHEDESSQMTVILDFIAPTTNDDVQVVCRYDFQDLGPDVEGEYSNTPTGMTINGQAVSRRDLFQAVNKATYVTGKQVLQDGAQTLKETLDQSNNR